MSRRSYLTSAQGEGDAIAAQATATTALANAATATTNAAAAQTTANTATTNAATAQAAANGAVAVNGFDLPSAADAETIPRGLISSITLAALTSAQLFLVAIPLTIGQVVNSISFLSGSTAVSTPVNQWFALFSSARVLRAISADDTNTAWGANTVKTLAMTSPYTITTNGLHYIGVMVKATIAVPTLSGVLVPNTTALNLAPIICGNADAGLSTPASCPATAGAITVAATLPFAYVS